MTSRSDYVTSGRTVCNLGTVPLNELRNSLMRFGQHTAKFKK
jgi:hypothetical protein